ncbi:hypothetical protein [Bartonella tamiae]|uniref:Uncharacterized protein n=1 Tax=Bartonella tamiae Th239 TaxID=1094558 RepID=J0QT95_9HYPH|nr:hypothetical protein [Bartonella tamiae]EJF89106.1 hypothetical protein ME5_01657 [Bartonella tamiae Th239]EJF95491.1 hypothetical protein MEG_00224 [Bartonella tamiae Th307]
MKKLIVALSLVVLSGGSAFASPVFGDGSPSNNYVAGQQGAVQHEIKSQLNIAGHFGDGSREDSYVQSRHIYTPKAQYHHMNDGRHFGDGSPLNQNS